MPYISLFAMTFGLNSCGVGKLSEAEIITACQQTIFSYAHSRDDVDLDANAALFTADATLKIRNMTLSGRSEIKAGLAERGPKQATRHVITSVSIEINEGENVSGKSYALLYAGPPALKNTQISPPLALKFILRYVDDLELDGADCLIKSRNVIIETVEF